MTGSLARGANSSLVVKNGTDISTDRGSEGWTDQHTDEWTDIGIDDELIGRQTYGLRDKQTDRWIERPINVSMYKEKPSRRGIDNQTDRPLDRQNDTDK